MTAHTENQLHPESQAVSAIKSAVKGDMPSNAQMDGIITNAQEGLKEQQHNPHVSDKGQHILNKVSSVLGAAKDVMHDKNEGDLIQKLAHSTKEAAKDMKSDVSPMDVDGVKHKVFKAKNSIQNLVLRLIKSSELRAEFESFVELLKKIMQEKYEENKDDLHHDKKHLEDKATSVKDDVKHDLKHATSIKEGVKDVKDTLKDAAQGLKLDSNIKDMQLTSEQQDALVKEALKIVDVIKHKKEFKDSIQDVYDLAIHLKEEFADKVEDATAHTHHKEKALDEFEELTHNFFGKENVEKFVNDLKALYKKVSSDEHLKEFFEKTNKFFTSLLKDEVHNNKEEFEQDLKHLIVETKNITHKYKYSKEYETIFKDVDSLLKEFKNDEKVKKFTLAKQSLVDEFVKKDEHNNIKIDFDAIKEVQSALGPLLVKQLDNIPIPRIEHEDDEFCITIDNMVFSAKDILPDYIKVNSSTDSLINLKELDKSKTETKIRIDIKEIKTEFLNVKFYVKKKTFPKLEDNGTFDAYLNGHGASLLIEIDVSKDKNSDVTFKGSKVNFDISNLKVNFQDDVHHPILLKLGTVFGKNEIKHKVGEAIVEKLVKIVDKVTEQMNVAVKKIKDGVTAGSGSITEQLISAVTN